MLQFCNTRIALNEKAFNLLYFLHCDGMNPFLIISKIKLGNLVSSIKGDDTVGSYPVVDKIPRKKPG